MRLSPKASENRIGPVAKNADGEAVLKAAVTAAPEGGKANAALIKLLAKSWHLPKTTVSVTKGARDRRKTVFIEGDPEEIMKSLKDRT